MSELKTLVADHLVARAELFDAQRNVNEAEGKVAVYLFENGMTHCLKINWAHVKRVVREQ